MSRPWETLDRRDTPDGVLELRRRGPDDFLILVGGRVLMNSRECRSEQVLGIAACRAMRSEASGEGEASKASEFRETPKARVLVGGLGMGLTLRAVLDTVPDSARVDVAELHPVIGEWCRGPLAELTEGALLDERVSLEITNVSDWIAQSPQGHYDAIVLDLFEGPHAKTHAEADPLYGRRAIDRTWHALAKGGVVAVWAEAPERAFEARLRKRGFRVESERPGKGGYRHWIVLARKP